jgi:hypothetical protein
MTRSLKAVTTLAALTLAGTAIAATEIDTDGDGVYSMEELVAVYPDMTEAGFTAVDADTDGVVSAEEFAAAIEAGLLPATASDG